MSKKKNTKKKSSNNKNIVKSTYVSSSDKQIEVTDESKAINDIEVTDKTNKISNIEATNESKESPNSEACTDSPIEEAKFSQEHNLDLISMSKKERKEAKKKELEDILSGMSKKEKAMYIFTYYKWYFLLPIIATILIVYIGSTIYKNSRPIALSYAVLNVVEPNALNKDFEQDFLECNNYSSKYRYTSNIEFDINYDYFIENKEFIITSNSTDYNTLQKACEFGDYDILITNMTGLKYCSEENVVNPLIGYFGADIIAKLKGKEVYSNDTNGIQLPYALDISDTEFAKRLNTGYDDIYLTFPGANANNKKNAIKFIEYVFGMTLSEE